MTGIRSPRPERDDRALTTSIAIISALAVVCAAVPLLLLDPRANDGAAVLVGIFGIPMIASAIAIEVLRRRVTAGGRPSRAILWWLLVVMPLGMVLLFIPGLVREPEYFEAETFWGAVGAVALMLLFVALGMLLGALVWFFLLFPLAAIVDIVASIVRGEKVSPARFVMPVLLLVLAALCLVGAASLDDLLPGRTAGGQIIAAILGIPGSYTVTWEAGLWIVRVIVVALIAWGVASARVGRRTRSRS